jgi:hypothetical protein
MAIASKRTIVLFLLPLCKNKSKKISLLNNGEENRMGFKNKCHRLLPQAFWLAFFLFFFLERDLPDLITK